MASEKGIATAKNRKHYPSPTETGIPGRRVALRGLSVIGQVLLLVFSVAFV